MNTEQLYTLAMMQLTLVILVASSRVQPADPWRCGLRYFQLSLAFDAVSWFFFLWPTDVTMQLLSNSASACNIWLLLAFALQRAGKSAPLLYLAPCAVAHAAGYTLLHDMGLEAASLHFMTIVTALVALPSAWLFCCQKASRTRSDQIYAIVMLVWLAVCVIRSVTVEFHPEWVLSGYLVSQVLWPGVMAAYGMFALTGFLEEAQNQLKADAMLDPLTGQLNRRGLQEAVNSCLAYLKRHQKQGALLMIDLDHFKFINDTFGHEVGDEVLLRVAADLKSVLRQSDILARLGGEEFLVFLPLADHEMAAQTADRLRRSVEALRWGSLLSGQHQQTISIGVSILGPCYDFNQQLKAADQALYLAKEQGRNRVQFAPISHEQNAT